MLSSHIHSVYSAMSCVGPGDMVDSTLPSPTFSSSVGIPVSTQCGKVGSCLLVFSMHNLGQLVCVVFFTPRLQGLFGYYFHPWHLDGREKVCQGCISETVRRRKLILCRDIGWECRCAMSWCDLDLTFYLVIVALSLKILSGPYLGKCMVL